MHSSPGHSDNGECAITQRDLHGLSLDSILNDNIRRLLEALVVEDHLRIELNEMTAMLTVIVYLFRAKPRTLVPIERAKAETPLSKSRSQRVPNSFLSSLLGEGNFNPST